MPSELTVILKDDHKTLRHKTLIYESYRTETQDFIIQQCVSKAKESFDGEPTDVSIKITMEL